MSRNRSLPTSYLANPFTHCIFAPEIKAIRRERSRSLLYFNTMSENTTLAVVKKMLEPLLTGDIFLVDMRIKPTNNIKIYLDADNGLGIEKCIKINRALYKNIEETALFPDGNFSLEVSSPGIDEPLKLHRQYEKNKGRNVEVVLNDGTVYEAVLSGIYENGIQLIITEGKGKKAVTKQLDIAMADIKHTKVKIKF